MENARKPEVRRWAAGTVLAGLVLFGIWYHIPIHRALDATAYEQHYAEIGAPAVLQMDITLHRSFLRGTVVRGTIRVDGVPYVSAPRMEPEPGFLDGLRDKWSGRISSGRFVEAERLAGRGDATYMMQDSFLISNVSFGGFYDSIEELFLIRWRPDAPSAVYTAGLHTY